MSATTKQELSLKLWRAGIAATNRYQREKRRQLDGIAEAIAVREARQAAALQTELECLVPLGRNPVMHSLMRDADIDQHRRIWCTLQAACINDAIARKWSSYSCSQCGVRSEVPSDERGTRGRQSWSALEETQDGLPGKMRG